LVLVKNISIHNRFDAFDAVTSCTGVWYLSGKERKENFAPGKINNLILRYWILLHCKEREIGKKSKLCCRIKFKLLKLNPTFFHGLVLRLKALLINLTISMSTLRSLQIIDEDRLENDYPYNFQFSFLFHTKLLLTSTWYKNRIHLIDAREERIYYQKPCGIQLIFKIRKPEKNKSGFFANILCDTELNKYTELCRRNVIRNESLSPSIAFV